MITDRKHCMDCKHFGLHVEEKCVYCAANPSDDEKLSALLERLSDIEDRLKKLESCNSSNSK